jgi:hypothetical protein
MKNPRTLSSAAAQVREFIEFVTRPGGFAPGDEQIAFGFQELATSLYLLQFEHNPAYRQFCEARNAAPETVRHWHQIPALPISAFKELEVTCLTDGQRARVFHSSGSSGRRPSRHFHNPESLSVYEASLLPWFRAHVSIPDGGRLVTLTPPTEKAPHSSLAYMFATVSAERHSHDSVFTGVVLEDGSWNFDLARTIGVLQGAISERRPVTLLGTAFLFVHLLDHLAEAGLRLRLPPDSCVLETGGYKGRSRSLPRAELHALIERHLGVPPRRVVSEYGMSELSSQAYQLNSRLTDGAFRFPPWARAQIIYFP